MEVHADSDSASVFPEGTGQTDVLGIPVHCGAARDIAHTLLRALRDPWDGRCRHVATVNPEYVMAARSDPDFAARLRRTDINTIDGIGVLLAVRIAGQRTAERLSGVEIVEILATQYGPLDAPMFVLGGRPGVANRAFARLRRRSPDLRLAGEWAGGTAAQVDDAEALRRIDASGARVLLVAYGATGQVGFIDRNREHLGARGIRLAIGIGGALDMLSGTMRRAPHPIRRLGMEWLFRLVTEPWRWRRQLALPRFALLVARDRMRRRP